MEHTRDRGINETCLKLQEFCDMDQLFSLLDNWSKSCGMATMIVDIAGNPLSEDFGMTEFCKLIQATERGKECCMATWKSDLDKIYECPFGFWDFSLPIVMPDGQVLGKVLAGQVLSVTQKEEEILQRTTGLGLDENTVREVLSRVHRKTEREMQGSCTLLKETLNFFIEKSYSIWKTKKELKTTPAKKDQILSELTQMLYSYNLTLNLRTGQYGMIIGNGMTQFMEIFKATDDYETAYNQIISYLNPEYIEQFAALASLDALRARTNANGFIGNLEYGAFTDYGEEWHEINVFVSINEDGESIANILGRDITDVHNRQEQRAKQQRAAMARDQLLSGVTKMLYSYNLTVNLETWTYSLITGTGMDMVLETLQRSDDYVITYAKLIQMIAPEDRGKIENLVGITALKEKSNATGFVGTVSCCLPGDESNEWHEVNLFMVTNEDGTPVANILGRDITEAHEQQEAKERELKASAARDQILSDITKMLYSYNATVNLNTGKYSLIIGTGMEEIIQHFSRTDDYETACAYLLEKALPEYPEEMNRRFSLEALRKQQNLRGHLGQIEYAAVTEKGIGWYEVNAFMGVDEEGNPTANILGRDITEAHDKADTKAQLEIANASSAAKSAFLFNMSHDIRTPMNAIIGFTELLKKNLDDKELAQSYIEKIETANDFLLSLINNVLEMARIESGKVILDEAANNVHEFWDALIALFETEMKEKGITFSRKIRVEQTNVMVDATKMRQILLNILSNAVKYTPSGGAVSMTVTELPSDRPGYIVYQTVIADTGIGMSDEFLPHIFEEFTRERTSTESKVIGSGLGMPIVKKLIDLMQGTIEVESELGKGTKFTLTLSHRIADDADTKLENERSDEYMIQDFVGKRILLAEDNELNAEITMTILTTEGFLVERAEDGIICVDMLQNAAPDYYDLILMDIQMPNMDGYKATQIIRRLPNQQKANIPIIAMTANAFEEDRKKASSMGMNGHIAKPMQIETFKNTLGYVLSQKEEDREIYTASTNSKIERYQNDSYLELEHINKEEQNV